MIPAVLAFKPGVTLTAEGDAVCLTMGQRIRCAQNARQALLLKALKRGSQSPESLAALLRESREAPEDDTQAALIIAAFILDFGDYLEA